MAQGNDKIAQSLLDLEPTAIVELFQLYFDTVEKEDSFIAFHGGAVFQKGIVWQGIEYLPIPVETEGFEVTANGELPRPKIRVANKDYFMTDLLISNSDLQFAKLIRKRTFVKFLDDVNFDGGNPWGQADASAEISKDTYVVGQKTAENKVFVELELTSPLDLENFEINNRLIMSRYCPWYYRGNGCNYKGVPIETEDGRFLTVSNPATWSSLGEWKINQNYLSGQAVYLENKKITLASTTDSALTEFAKIWYVCQQNHLSAVDKKPDVNENYWLRDGCNKKLDGCRKRFGLGLVELNQEKQFRTVNYVSFLSRTGDARYNNIAPLSQASALSFALGNSPRGAVDLSTGLYNEWITKTIPAVITLEWSEPKTISQINIYDLKNSNNFNNAYIRYFNAAGSVVNSGLLRNIPTNGSRISSGFSPISVKKIDISGSGTYGVPGLAEVAVFESTSPHLIYVDDNATKLHQNNFFQISAQIDFSGRSLAPNEVYSVFHNVGATEASRFSGINLYLSGTNMYLDFATRLTGQDTGVASTNKTISIPWNNDFLRPIHLICSGGQATGNAPIAANGGYIRLTDGIENNSQYTLASQSGEYFKFKNTSYQSGINTGQSGLKFGFNDWQFSTGTDSRGVPALDPLSSQISNSMKIHSPIRFGQMAIWTGANGIESRINQYNAEDFIYKRYEEISGRAEITGGLVGWWEMEITGGNGEIVSENSPSNKLKIITGAYPYSTFQSSSSKTVLATVTLPIKKQDETLPFGGFPGTEQYG